MTLIFVWLPVFILYKLGVSPFISTPAIVFFYWRMANKVEKQEKADAARIRANIMKPHPIKATPKMPTKEEQDARYMPPELRKHLGLR